MVLERAARAGGLVETEVVARRFVVEHGAESLSLNPARPLRIADLAPELVWATAAEQRAYVVTERGLAPVARAHTAPGSRALWRLSASPALSLRGRLRAALGVLAGGESLRPDELDERMSDAVVRRVGREAYERVVEPIVSAVPGTSSDTASLRASWWPRGIAPTTAEAQQPAPGATRQRPSRAGRPASLATMSGGLTSLTRLVERALGPRVELRDGGARARARRGRTLRRAHDPGALEADRVIVALPAPTAAALLEPLDPDLAGLLGSIAHEPVTSVALAYRRRDVPHPLDATGFAAPRASGRAVASCTWSSALFPSRAPDDAVLLRCFSHERDAGDAELEAAVRDELRELMGIAAEPLFVRTRRISPGVPKYSVGHVGLLVCVERTAASHGALAIAGNSIGGVRIPDCVASAARAADAVAATQQKERRAH